LAAAAGAPLGFFTTTSLGLTWDEALAVAQSPLVTRVWQEEDATSTGKDGCPRDLSQPVVPPECTEARESGDSKIAKARDLLLGDATLSEPYEVMVNVRGGAKICPHPDCPDRGEECPESKALFSYYDAESRASQTCVRAFLAELGGRVDAEFVGFANAFSTELSWAQIQQLATHPHVQAIYPVPTAAQ
jgi:hypothetical protein